MTPEEQETFAQGIGQAISELVDGFVKIINALRKQPGFDEDAFRSQLQALLATGELRTLEEHTVKKVLGSDDSTA